MFMRVIIAAAFLASAGCNTVEGLGRDLTAVGGTVTKSASTAKAGKTRVITRDPAACLPDAHGRVPSGQCGVTRASTSKAKAPARQPVKTTSATTATTASLQGGVAPVNTKAEPVKASSRPKLGWWQPACGKPGERPCSRTGQ